MTAAQQQPATRIVRRNYGRNHGYQIDGEKVLGVTSVVGTLDKPALVNWAAERAADLVVNDWDRLAALPVADRYKEVKSAHRSSSTTAAVRGNEIHHYAEKLLAGADVAVPDEIRGPVEAAARFLDRWQIEPIASETPCGSPTYGYGGTADLWGRVGVRDNGVALIDWKTGKGVYDESALQLSGYRYSELMQPERGVEIATPAVDLVYVAHVTPDDVRMLPVVADETVFRTFLYLLQVARARADWKEWPLIGASVRHDEPEDFG